MQSDDVSVVDPLVVSVVWVGEVTVEVDDEGAVVCGVEDCVVVMLDAGAGAHVEPELAGCVDAAAESGPEPC